MRKKLSEFFMFHSYFERVKIDIADFDINVIVGIAKHLCGVSFELNVDAKEQVGRRAKFMLQQSESRFRKQKSSCETDVQA